MGWIHGLIGWKLPRFPPANNPNFYVKSLPDVCFYSKTVLTVGSGDRVLSNISMSGHLKPVGAPFLLSRWPLALLALVVFAIPVAAYLFFDRGIVDPEGAVFLRQYWEDLPFGEMVFNPNRNDWGFYSGRELSHIFDWLDCLFVRAVALHYQEIAGVHLSAWLANLILMSLVVWRGPAVFPRTNRVFWLLLAGIYLSSLPIMLSPLVFHRSSRLLSATAGLAALWLLVDCRLSADRNPKPRWAGGNGHHAILAVVAATSVLMDRIGLAVILAALGMTFLYALWRRRAWSTVAWLGGAIVVCQIYHSLIGPALNARFSGYTAEVVAQPFTTTGLAPVDLAVSTATYIANVVPQVLGGLPWWGAILGLSILAVVAWRSAPQEGKSARFAALALAAAAGLATAFAITLATIYVLPAIRSLPSANCYYYPVYVASLLWFGLAMGGALLLSGPDGLARRLFPWCLAALLASNLIHWPTWKSRLPTCTWFSGMVADTVSLRKSCVEKKMNPAMSGRHRRLLSVLAEECPWLSASYWPAVEPLTGFFVARSDSGVPCQFWVAPGAKMRIHAPAKGKYEVKMTVAAVVGGEAQLAIKSKDSVAGEFELPTRPGDIRDIHLTLDLKKGNTTLEFNPNVTGPMLSKLGMAETSDGTDAPIGCALVGMPVLRSLDK